MLDTKSLSLEGVASVILAVGLVSAYFLGSNLTGGSETKSKEGESKTPSKKVAETGKKGKKKKNAAASQVEQPSAPEAPRLPGGNDTYTGSVETTVPDPVDPALVAASIEAGVAAQEHREKAKKAKKKAKKSTKEAAQAAPATSSTAKPKAKRPTAQAVAPNVDGGDADEWRVVGRSRKSANNAAMTDSAASFTTTSATEPNSPKDEGSHIQNLESSEVKNNNVTSSEPEELHQVVESPQPSSLMASRDFGETDGAGAESTEDDGFIAVKSGRRRAQRTVSSSSAGGGSAIRSSETQTKKQRQNRAKREAEKAAKAEFAQQQAKGLTEHRRNLEKVRIEELHKKGKQLSGGMSMSVGDTGKAEWN